LLSTDHKQFHEIWSQLLFIYTLF